MKYLITGGLGFLGSNLSNEVIRRNEELFILDNFFRKGCNQNLNWLRKKGSFEFLYGDIRNNNDVESIIREIKPDVIFHVAGQVAMTTSLKDPRLDFEVNTLGTINILESVRKFSSNSSIIYTSTNKVYGDLEYLEYIEKDTRYISKKYPRGFNESLSLNFQSPYGCSKGAADQYILDYARMFDLNTVVFRHSTIYGTRQFSTFDQGWIGWFCQKALEIKNGILKDKLTISGNGKQVRDILFIDDVVNLYFMAAKKINTLKGKVFNIGGGIDNSISILELFDMLEKKLNIQLKYEKLRPREGDQKFFVTNIDKAKNLIKWRPDVSIDEGIDKMIEWISIT